VWGKGISQNVVWYVVKNCCERAGLEHIAPHDLRRTCAKLCHSSGGELEQIQFLLGHASVQTTERYLGCKQNLGHPTSCYCRHKGEMRFVCTTMYVSCVTAGLCLTFVA